MQIDFKALEQALAPIAEIGQGELTFDAGGTTLTVRVLRPFEEIDAQRYAAQALEEENAQAAVEYLDRFRLACLSYAIVAVGGQDFRNVDYVTTGETLEGGIPVKTPRHKAMRELLSKWTRATLAAVFTKFHELLTRTEREAEKAIVFEPSDIPTEIERLQQRITELRAEQEKATLAEKTKFSEAVATAESLVPDQPPPATLREVAPPVQAPAPPPPVQEPAPLPRRTGPIIPQQAPPPPERPVVHVPPPQATTMPQAAPEPVYAPPPPRADTSFINADDDEGMNAALDAEHHRLLEMRRRAALGLRQEGGAALDTARPFVQSRRRPPHLEAAETDAGVGLMDAVAQRARELGQTAEGVPVFALPAQDLEVQSPRPRPDRGALDPQVRAGGATNPRFQGARRP